MPKAVTSFRSSVGSPSLALIAWMHGRPDGRKCRPILGKVKGALPQAIRQAHRTVAVLHAIVSPWGQLCFCVDLDPTPRQQVKIQLVVSRWIPCRAGGAESRHSRQESRWTHSGMPASGSFHPSAKQAAPVDRVPQAPGQSRKRRPLRVVWSRGEQPYTYKTQYDKTNTQ